MERVFVDSEFQDLIDQLQQDRISGDLDKLKQDAKELEERAIYSENDYAESVACYFLAIYCLMRNEATKSISYCDRVKEKYKKHQSHYLYVTCCNLGGTAYVHLNNLQNAICYFLDGYYIGVEHSFVELQIQILNNIGSIFYELENYKKAVEYYSSAYDLIQKHGYNNPYLTEMLFVNLSSSYVRKNKFEEARYWEQQYLERYQDSKNPLITHGLLVNHILMGNSNQQYAKDVKQFLECVREGWHDSYSIKLVFEVIQFCLQMKDIELSKRSIEVVEHKLQYYHRTTYKQQLASAKIELYQLVNDKEALFEALIQYHDYVKKIQTEQKEVESFGLLSKINLEQAEHRRKQIELKNEELERVNELDSFTGLLNKAAFEKKVQQVLLFRTDGIGENVLLLVDLDNFKGVNDTYGHLAGDEVLKKIASTLKGKARETDYVGRIGGDEFAILLFNVPNKKSIGKWIQGLLQNIQNLQYEGIHDRKITVSIGAATITHESFYAELLEKADKALYETKKNGKNAYKIYGT